ncbi:MAG: hypothetical protein Kow0098_12170 [Ignavibacteriaceae bacterium]
MKLLYLITFICFQICYTVFPQNILHSAENIRRFADHLFCSDDYLRAADEYSRLSLTDDTLKIKLALSYTETGDYNNALIYLDKVEPFSSFYSYAVSEKGRVYFIQNEYEKIDSIISFNENLLTKEKLNTLKTLALYSLFYRDNELPDKKTFINSFGDSLKDEIEDFYHLKSNPPVKNPLTAAILSAIVPGLGKIYTGDYGDGITAFIATGLFAFLSYNNFENHHNFRGWLFAGISGLFYAGNIYGSASSAQIFNTQFHFSFRADLDAFIEYHKFFIEEIDFCQ